MPTYGQVLCSRIRDRETMREVAAARREIEQWRQGRYAIDRDRVRLDDIESERMPAREKMLALRAEGYTFAEAQAEEFTAGKSASVVDAYCQAIRDNCPKRYTPPMALEPIELSTHAAEGKRMKDLHQKYSMKGIHKTSAQIREELGLKATR
jgi:hypothetical protein